MLVVAMESMTTTHAQNFAVSVADHERTRFQKSTMPQFHNSRRSLPCPVSRESTCFRSFGTVAVHNDDDSPRNGIIPFLLADIGEGIAEVELLQWFVQEGDKVQQFDRICEVQSDKATVEITSRYDGTITSLEHDKGDMVKVGTALLYLESDEEHASSRQPTISTRTHSMEDDEKLNIPTIASQFHVPGDNSLLNVAEGNTTTEATRARAMDAVATKVSTSPAIRKLAMEHSLDLSTIVGTGPKRRVLKGDVLTVLKERGLVAREPTGAIPVIKEDASPASYVAEAKENSSSRLTSSAVTSIDQVRLPLEQDTVLEMRGYNRLMVQKMTASLQIPHMVYADEIDVTRLRTQYKAELPFLPYCIKALSMSLAQYPLLNASFDSNQNQVMLWADHNIGIAMDTPRGLIVPVIKQVQNKSLTEIATDLHRLKECAKESTVSPEDLQGATFTLSNIGALGDGGTYMSPIVTSPQVAIGALGKIQRVPRFVSEDSMQVQEAYIVNISWAGDHRVIDGATLARFQKQWKRYLQDPIGMIRSMK